MMTPEDQAAIDVLLKENPDLAAAVAQAAAAQQQQQQAPPKPDTAALLQNPMVKKAMGDMHRDGQAESAQFAESQAQQAALSQSMFNDILGMGGEAAAELPEDIQKVVNTLRANPALTPYVLQYLAAAETRIQAAWVVELDKLSAGFAPAAAPELGPITKPADPAPASGLGEGPRL